jgi:hypothetical protein
MTLIASSAEASCEADRLRVGKIVELFDDLTHVRE